MLSASNMGQAPSGLRRSELSEFMKAQYQVLGELRKIDEKIARLDLDIEKIPEEQNKLNESLGSRKTAYDTAKRLFDEIEKKLRRAESDLKEKEDKLAKAEDKMREVKTNEEFQAATKENEGQKKEKSTLESLVITLLSEVEAQKTKLKDVEKEFKTYQEAIGKDIVKLEEERTRLAHTLEEAVSKRTSAAGQLSPDVAGLYKRVTSRMKGVAVVAAENGMCQGCNMKIRPQVYNEILGFKAVHSCPSCGRIVIIPSADIAGSDVSDLAEK